MTIYTQITFTRIPVHITHSIHFKETIVCSPHYSLGRDAKPMLLHASINGIGQQVSLLMTQKAHPFTNSFFCLTWFASLDCLEKSCLPPVRAELCRPSHLLNQSC